MSLTYGTGIILNPRAAATISCNTIGNAVSKSGDTATPNWRLSQRALNPYTCRKMPQKASLLRRNALLKDIFDLDEEYVGHPYVPGSFACRSAGWSPKPPSAVNMHCGKRSTALFERHKI